MSEFVVRIGTAGGEIVERQFVAANEASLRRELDEKGLYVFSVERRRGAFQLGFRSGRVPERDFSVFNHELATLLKAGLPLLQGLDILLERLQNPLFRGLLLEIRDRVKDGTALSDAFASYPQYFEPLYATSLRAGERSGELETVIRRYLVYSKLVREVRKKVIQALIYPAFLLSLSVIVVGILLLYAIPKFAGLYSSFGSELPAMTRFMIGLAEFLRSQWPFLALGAGAAFAAFMVAKDTERGQEAMEMAIMRIPLVGPVWQKFSVSQLTRALSTLLSGGIPLVTALDVSADAVGSRLISRRAKAAVQDVREGQPLSAGLEATQVIQPMVIEMVRVGESTGALAEMLENVADYFDEDIATELQRLLSLLEPTLLVVMGGIIAFMLSAMYLPIFGLQSVIQ